MIYIDDSDPYNQYFRIIKIMSSKEKAIKEIERLEKEEPCVDGFGESIYNYREYEVF